MIDHRGSSDLKVLENDATKRTKPSRSAVLSPSMSRSTPSKFQGGEQRRHVPGEPTARGSTGWAATERMTEVLCEKT